MEKTSAMIQINALPPEVLTYIFSFSQPPYCSSRNRDHEYFSLHIVTAVCTYWRQLAIGTPRLWTHIDIGPSFPLCWALQCLERTKDKGIHVHLHQVKPLLVRCGYSLGLGVILVLGPHVQRIRTLHLQPFAHLTTGLEPRKAVPETWLSYEDVPLSMSLSLSQDTPPDSKLYIGGPRPDPGVNQSKDAGQALPLSITAFHLEGTILPWTSYAYHNLAELELQFRWDTTSVSQLQLTGIFSASPALVTLKLAYLQIDRTEGPLPSTPTLLGRLKLLALRLDSGSLELLLPLISVSDSGDLSVGVTFHEQPQVALEAFFSRFKMVTLYCYDPLLQYLRPRPSLLRSLTRVSTVLILKDFLIDDEYNTTDSESRFFTSRIPNVIAVSCKVTFEGLKGLVTEHQIHNLRLQRCVLPTSTRESQSLEGIRILLLEIYPDLEVSIEDTDSTYDHPVRHWDEYSW